MDTDSGTDELRERLGAWLADVTVADGEPRALPAGVETAHIVGALRLREARHLEQARALIELTGIVGRRTGGLADSLSAITERCARTLRVARASVWRHAADGSSIRCADLYELDAGVHSGGAELRACDFPAYFAAVRKSDVLDAEDASADPRTCEFAEPYLRPLGISSMMDARIHVDGAVAGVLCCEHVGPTPRRWTTDEKAFAIAVANLVSLALEADERERARRALRISEQRFRSVARAITDTIWDWDLANDVIWWNDGLESQFGHRLDALSTRAPSWREHIHLEDRERVMNGIRAAIDGDAEQWSDEYRFICGDGTAVHVQDTGVIMRDDDGVAVRMVGGMIDVTTRRRTEEELIRARELAEEASRVKTEFLANMSHEMRTPLTAVLGFSDLLMDPTLGAGDRLDYVQSIRRNGAHLLALIDDVLDLSSMDSKVAGLQRTDCSMHRILNEVASMMQVRASYKGLAFSMSYETPIPASVQGDPDRIRQILLKLIGNAIKFTDEGSIRVVARLRLGGKGASAVEIDVVDTGIGIAKDDLAQVFQPFWQANGSTVRRHGGSGLGLPICLPLARAMGGDILVKSELGRGSTFSLRLPHAMESASRMVRHPTEAFEAATGAQFADADDHADGHADGDGGDAQRERPTPTVGARKIGRILLAEDGPDNQLLISTMLGKRGYEVTVVDNGADAVERALLAAASGQPFHVILMDMQMPRLDGYGATALLRSRGYGRPIFALTAHAMPDERKRCLVAGCNEFLSKPVTWPLLLSTIDTYLQREEAGDAMGTELTDAATDIGRVDDRTPIHSTLADDPDMADLVAGFVERLPGQVAEIREALLDADQERLRRIAHQLKGAGGSYGFDAVSECAARLEQAAKAEVPTVHVAQRVDEFEALCARIRSGPAAGALHE